MGIEEFRRDTLLTPECVLSLKELCDRFKNSQGKGEWDVCLNEHETDELSAEYQADAGHKKRKSEITDLGTDAEVDEPQSKRRKTDLAAQGDAEDGQVAANPEESDVIRAQLGKELEGDSSATLAVPEEDGSHVLPDHIKVKWKWAQIIQTFCEKLVLR